MCNKNTVVYIFQDSMKKLNGNGFQQVPDFQYHQYSYLIYNENYVNQNTMYMH